MKNTLLLAMAAVVAGSVSSANAGTTTGFGTLPGASGNPYSGSGIPYNTSEYSQISGLPGSDTLTLGMAATQHGSSNPAPGNNGAGTYTVNTGLVSGRSPWNFDFYINSADNDLAAYTFTITETGNGDTYSFNPLAIPDNVGGPASAGNSESLDFAAFGVPIAYNANDNDTYGFTLAAYEGSTEVGSDSITVIAGTGASAPDAYSSGILLAGSVAALTGLRRRFVRA